MLESLGITAERVRRQVIQIAGTGEELATGQIPFTPRAKNALELALVRGDNGGVAVRILRDFDVDSAKIRTAVTTYLSGSGGRWRPEAPAHSGPEQRGTTAPPAIDPGWLDGLPLLLAPLAAEIRAELGRAPDLGDLLLCLAGVPHTPAAQALDQLGVDVDQLPALIERARAQAQAAQPGLAERMLEVTQAKELAIEQGRFQDAAQLRDQERRLHQQVRAHPPAQLAALNELRRRLGLPAPPQP